MGGGLDNIFAIKLEPPRRPTVSFGRAENITHGKRSNPMVKTIGEWKKEQSVGSHSIMSEGIRETETGTVAPGKLEGLSRPLQ